ncbi:MAG TPA: hypothetical protein VIF57_01520 [Polyangia bacterium]
MKKLEARFHPPFAATGAYVIVGHIVTDTDDAGASPRVEAAPSLAGHRSPATILATLKHLVATTAPRTFERLGSLRSRYWSFVLVGDAAPPAAAD